MKYIISFMIMLALFPIISISCKAFDIDNITFLTIFILYLKTSLIVTFTVFLSDSFIRSKHKKILQGLIVSMLSIILAILDGFIVGDISPILWIVSNIALTLILLRVYYIEDDAFSNAYVFIVVSLIYIICTFIGWQTELGSYKLIDAVLYLTFCSMFAILINRNHLKKVIHRRTQNLDSIPKSIFRYNSKLTLILCLIPLPLMLLSSRIGSAIYGIFISLCRLLVYTINLIAMMFQKDSTDISTDNDSTTEYQPYYEETSNIFWDICTIISIVFIAFLIYHYHEDIIKKAKDIITNIKHKIVTLFKYIDTTTIKEVPSNEGYTDYIKDTIPNRYTKRLFKKDYKLYLKMPTSRESICFGYDVLIKGLNVLNYGIQPFHTITDISKMLNCNEFSKVYLAIRYNNYEPTNSDRLLLNNLLKDTLKKM